MTRRPMKPDSIPARTARVLLAETARLSRGVVLSELVAAYVAMFGQIRSNNVSHALAVLRGRGLVVKTGGRHGHTRYAHVEGVPIEHDTRDPAAAIIEIVDTHGRQSGRALTAAQIHTALKDCGDTSMSVDQVRTKLNSLAHTSPRKARRSHGDWRGPQIQKIVRTSRGGVRSLFWAPAEGDYATPTFLNRSDAVRFALSDAEDRLGLPITKTDLRSWGHAALAGVFGSLQAEAAEHVLAAGLAGVVDGIAQRDEGNRASGAVRQVRTSMTSRGNYRARFSTRAPGKARETACWVEDATTLLAPDRELAEIELLEEKAAELSCESRAQIARVRRLLLSAEVLRIVPGDPGDIKAGVERCAGARQVLEDWASYEPASYGWKYDARIDALAEEQESLEALAQALQGNEALGEAESDLIGISRTRGSAMESFEELALEANAIIGSDAQHWQNQLVEARRVRGARANGVAGATAPRNRAWLDRPDTLSVLVRACHLPELGAWVAGAQSVIGYVLRDSAWLTHRLAELPAAPSALRNELIVALGLLGQVPRLEIACPDPSDRPAVTAFLAAVSLGIDDFEERVRRAEEADLHAEGGAMDITELALGRLEAGARLSVLG